MNGYQDVDANKWLLVSLTPEGGWLFPCSALSGANELDPTSDLVCYNASYYDIEDGTVQVNQKEERWKQLQNYS